jgi:hypothetical protein
LDALLKVPVILPIEAVPVVSDFNVTDLPPKSAVPAIVRVLPEFMVKEPVPLIEYAALIMGIADVFLLIGTSLQVYPAAGLIHYLPDQTPKFIIDKKIPPTGALQNLKIIEASATVGIEAFVKELK